MKPNPEDLLRSLKYKQKPLMLKITLDRSKIKRLLKKLKT